MHGKLYSLEYGERAELIRELRSCCEEGNQAKFNDAILKISNIPTNVDCKEIMRKQYKSDLEFYEKFLHTNDLNSIFRNCRDYHLNNVVINGKIGGVEKGRDGKAVFKENVERTEKMSLKLDDWEIPL